MAKAIATISRTKEIMETHRLHTKKKFGQNFLTEPSIVTRIAQSVPMADKRLLIEIGPGIGALTEQLALVADKVIAYEIDDDLIPVLADTLAEYPHVEIRHQDFLTVNLKEELAPFMNDGYEISIAANLPYYITTPLLFHILESDVPITSITVMMQKEVADRFAAQVGTKDYNALSVITQYRADVKMVMKVPKEVFVPKPNVDSAVIQFRLRPYSKQVEKQEEFFELVKGCFVQRRKTILNNLSVYLKDKDKAREYLEKANIDPARRAETCTLDTFIELYEVMSC